MTENGTLEESPEESLEAPPNRIYLDNAATSWPKPESVYRAVDQYQRAIGAPAGRGVYREAEEVERTVAQCRLLTSQLIGAADPRQVAFAFNGTDALNMALHGALRRGDHVVTSCAEHNSVLRPLRHLEETLELRVDRAACDGQGRFDVESLERALRDDTRLVAVTHASNVTGAVQPVEEVARLLRGRDTLLLIDAAQTLGHLTLNVERLGADLLAASGHKGLLGPLGTGVLYVGDRAAELVPFRQGGTGTQSEEDRQPRSLPDRLESGNHNVPGLFGLHAALVELERCGVDARRTHHVALTARLLEGLRGVRGATLYGPGDPERQTGVVSLRLDGYDPRELAVLLDSAAQIQARAGFHCAPLTHRALGTAAGGGTLRLSVGAFNTMEQIETVLKVLAELSP